MTRRNLTFLMAAFTVSFTLLIHDHCISYDDWGVYRCYGGGPLSGSICFDSRTRLASPDSLG